MKQHVQEFAYINYSSLPFHMISGIRMYIEEGVEPGSFLRAVLENKLVDAYAHADEINTLHMKQWAMFLYNQAPRGCWGSPETVNYWINQRRQLIASTPKPETRTLNFHSDPGHGWLEVPVSELDELGIRQDISPYSYISGDEQTAYLEEDCDADRYLRHLKGTGVLFQLNEQSTDTDSFIRSLKSFH